MFRDRNRLHPVFTVVSLSLAAHGVSLTLDYEFPTHPERRRKQEREDNIRQEEQRQRHTEGSSESHKPVKNKPEFQQNQKERNKK